MSDAGLDLSRALGTAAGVGLLAVVAGRTKLALLGSVAAGAAAALTLSRRHADEQTNSMGEQIRELEQALATQVQRRMDAEEAVRSLSEQLSVAEKRAGEASAPILLSDSGVGGTALVDPVTGLLSQEYFVVALDSRLAAARRHLRPVSVAVFQVVDGRKADNRPNTEPVVVADALRATLRESDTLTHLHDGRFGVVLEDTAESGAMSTMERLRLHLEERHPSQTLWVGIACYPAHALTAGELIDRADTALAAARDWHQSRIEVADDE